MRGKKRHMFGLFLFLCCFCGLFLVTICSFARFSAGSWWWKIKVRDTLIWWSLECDLFIHAVIFGAGWNVYPTADCLLRQLLVSTAAVYVEYYYAANSKSAKCWQLFCWSRTLPRIQMDMYHNLKHICIINIQKTVHFLERITLAVHKPTTDLFFRITWSKQLTQA